jgi:1-acyl-sn-glycerol-3-phosphate acyltransferase
MAQIESHRPRVTVGRVERRLARLEAEMDQLLHAVAHEEGTLEGLNPGRRRDLEMALTSFAERMQRQLRAIEPAVDDEVVHQVRQVTPGHLLRLVARWRMRHRSSHVDEFGADSVVQQRYAPALDFLYRRYFRVRVEGMAHIPSEGRCVLVANRSGGLVPWDALMIKEAVHREHHRRRQVRWLTEGLVYNQPLLGQVATQLGGVRACQENAQRLLTREELVCVFPEGVIGATKLFRDRYRLGRFGRGGYVRLLLRTGAPLVPVAVVGAEEAHPVVARLGPGSRVAGGLPWPVTPTFPLLGPLGLLPLPTRWWVVVGEPLRFEQGPEAAEDVLLVRRLNEMVRQRLQTMVDQALTQRQSVIF